MDIKEFADKHRAKMQKDDCADVIIVGKHGNIYDGFSDALLGVCLIFNSAKKWGHARRKLEAAGLTIRQDAHSEGCAAFDPRNKTQARLALKLVGARIRRRLSEEQRQAATERLRLARGRIKMPVAA